MVLQKVKSFENEKTNIKFYSIFKILGEKQIFCQTMKIITSPVENKVKFICQNWFSFHRFAKQNLNCFKQEHYNLV